MVIYKYSKYCYEVHLVEVEITSLRHVAEERNCPIEDVLKYLIEYGLSESTDNDSGKRV